MSTDQGGANRGWKDYWQADRLQSCVPVDATTEREIAEGWVSQFAALPDRSRILDIGTGNGVLLAHAATCAMHSGKKFELTGIDLADIDPAKYVDDHPAVRHDAQFLGRVDAATLPFADASFDAVVSQFGLEYADIDRALDEVGRVLAHNGRMVWLAHSEDSVVVAQNRDQETQVGLLLADAGPLAAMGDFVDAIAGRRQLDRVTGQLRSALQRAETYCRDHPPADIVRSVCTVIAETARDAYQYRPEDLQHMLQDSARKLDAHSHRINDMNAAVLSGRRKRQVLDRLNSAPWSNAVSGAWRVGRDDSPIGVLFEAVIGSE
ncbi:MAG: class I SAM-dependent methyltransferase [Gammaproteobacteria bacterium]|nr:class I SAM-dependent methyltransferase [Gammaproteobacteria bacterium]